MRKTTLEVLEGALGYIRVHGWTQRRFGFGKHHPHAPACALGALYAAVDMDPYELRPDPREWAFARDRLVSCLPRDWYSVSGYNDLSDTTQADVEALFERAIAAEANG